MLFNTYEFIFFFLAPLILVVYLLNPKYTLPTIILASVIFYANWDLLHLALLLASIVLNYTISYFIQNSIQKKLLLILGVVLNISVLIYFKYSVFLSISTHDLILPLAISFYTFQQIAYLYDVYKQQIFDISFQNYLFFVLFFPQLIAGPIVHYNQLIPQIKNITINTTYFLAGFVVFTIGLSKKILLADNLSPIANQGFTLVQHSTIGSLDAILALLAYSFQIYFDFSGYSDMAIGLALIFGIVLPINFNSPYKAISIIDFWRRWHITLSNFLKDHIYIPLGGNRLSKYNTTLNLLITMTIGGIWHGSGWGFLLWGLAHGILLVITHAAPKTLGYLSFKPLLITLTFTLVTLLWVLFRSPTLEVATTYYGIIFSFDIAQLQNIITILSQGIYYNIFTDNRIFLLLLSTVLIWFIPFNSNKFISLKKPKPFIIILTTLLFITCMKSIATTPANTFLYFNF